MNQLIQALMLEVVLLTIGILSHYFFWLKVAPDAMVVHFSADADASVPVQERRRRSFNTDVVRAVLVMILVYIGLAVFIPEIPGGLNTLLTSPSMLSIGGGLSIFGFFWYGYFGPKKTALDMQSKQTTSSGTKFRFFSKDTLREYVGPYLVSFPYQLAVVGIVGGLAASIIFTGITSEATPQTDESGR